MRYARAAGLALLLLASAARAVDFPAPVNTQTGEPMPAADALKSVKAPPGFKV